MVLGYFPSSVVLQETGGNGVGRLMEATGAPTMVNGCFTLLRYFIQWPYMDTTMSYVYRPFGSSL